MTFNVRHFQPSHPDVTVLRPGEFVLHARDLLARLAADQQTGNRHNEITALQLAGNGALGLGSYRQALVYYQQALTAAQELDDPWLEARMLSGMGDVYGRLSDYDQALTCYDQSLAIDKEIGEQQGESMTLVRIGAIYGQARFLASRRAGHRTRQLESRRGHDPLTGQRLFRQVWILLLDPRRGPEPGHRSGIA